MVDIDNAPMLTKIDSINEGYNNKIALINCNINVFKGTETMHYQYKIVIKKDNDAGLSFYISVEIFQHISKRILLVHPKVQFYIIPFIYR